VCIVTCPASTAPLPCFQANKAGVEEALMLDPFGFVATCNSTNFFVVRKGEVSECEREGVLC